MKCRQCGDGLTGYRRAFCETCAPYMGKGKNAKWGQMITTYGVDKFMWDAMYFEQDGKCLICDDREADAVDHCHKTGRVRGPLCRGCNGRLSFIETEGRLNVALNYIKEGVY